MKFLVNPPPLHRGIFLGLGIVALVVGFAGGFATHASAGITATALSACQAFPKVGVWKNLTHATVRTQVERKYSGDWQAYIGRLEGYGNQLRRIRAKGKSARVTRGGQKVRLHGQDITRFLAHVDKRIAVTRCLAETQAENFDVASIAEFSTAAGGTDADRLVETFEKPDQMQCGAIPHVDWWTFKTHDSVAGYVFRKHNGDWAPYIDKWNNRLAKLQNIYARGSSAVTKTGSTLKGISLANYIGKMRTRITVTHCLAKKFGPSET